MPLDPSFVYHRPIPHLKARALEYQVPSFYEVQGEFEVQVGSSAQTLQVTNQLCQSGVVQPTVTQRNVALDLGAAVDTLHQVTLGKKHMLIGKGIGSLIKKGKDRWCVCYLQVLVYSAVLLHSV